MVRAICTSSDVGYYIPNATNNTFLINSKPTKYRPILFKPLLDKCLRHSIVEFERPASFHASIFALCLMVPPFEKVTKRKQKITFFNFVLLYVNVLFLPFVDIVVKSTKIYQNLLKNGQAMTSKNNRSEHFVSQ